MRPQRVRAIGSSSGWVTWKKPCSETSMTLCHCAALMPAIGASSWMPALLTSTWIGPASSSAASACALACASATSNATASALPPAATIASNTAAARATLALACTITCRPCAARARQIAPPRSPLPPVTRARRGEAGWDIVVPWAKGQGRHPNDSSRTAGTPSDAAAAAGGRYRGNLSRSMTHDTAKRHLQECACALPGCTVGRTSVPTPSKPGSSASRACWAVDAYAVTPRPASPSRDPRPATARHG
ncbi:hypothetical protein NB723_003913 [Xanthomonas sacchari]|nr:hypothetical protein [Xanthomonas sacchari]